MLKRPEAKVLTPEEIALVQEAGQNQTAGSQIVRSYDDNFPLHETPAGKKILVYIPNNVVTSPQGVPSLRCDRYGAHAVKDGKQFGMIRCSNGVELPSLGLDGTCPCCDSVEKCWDVYNKQYESLCKAKGIDTSTEDGYKAADPIRKGLMEKFAIQKADIFLTFPIVVIETLEKDGIGTGVPKKDDKGQLVGKPFFLTVRESTYLEKWIKPLDSLSVDTVITHPAGTWATLNYQVTGKDGRVIENPKARDAARDMVVSYKQFPADYAQWAEYFDKLTAAWTPEKAMEVLVANQVRSMAEMNEVTDTVMKKTLDMHALLCTDAVAVVPAGAQVVAQGSPESTLAGFGATPVGATPEVPIDDSAMGTAPVVDGAPVVGGAPVV